MWALQQAALFNIFHPQPRCLCLPQMREGNYLPLAQMVQAVLGFHVDRWDPGTGAERENTTLNYCAC